MPDIKLEPSWKAVLQDEFTKEYMQTLRSFLKNEKAQRKRIYPKGVEYFRAMDLTPFEQVLSLIHI